MPEYGQSITWQSKPDYDGWGADRYWSCADWMIWFDRLEEKYGSAEAKLLWKSAWDKQDSWESNVNWCKYEPMFNKFLKENELGSSNLVADAALGLGALGTSALKGLGWFGRNAGWVVPTALMIGGVVYALKIRKLVK